VRLLDDAIGPRIVSTDSDMLDVVLLLDVSKCHDEGLAIVGDDLHEHAPSADDVLEDPVTERLRCLLAEHAKFWIVSK